MEYFSFMPDFFVQLSYGGFFILLAFVGYFVPIPEEIILLFAGYLAGIGLLSLPLVLLVSICGVVVGDNVVFWLTRHGSEFIEKLKGKIKDKKLERYEERIHTKVGRTIFFLRFIPGLRFLGPLIAGSSEVPWKVFQFYNLMAVIIYVPLLVLIGHKFQAKIAHILNGVESMRHTIFFVFIIVVGLVLTLFAHRLFYEKPEKKTF